MIKIASLMLRLRTATGDTDPKKYRFNDPQLLDVINAALDAVAEDTHWSTRTWVIPCTEGVGRYALPADWLRPMGVMVNGVWQKEIESLEHRIASGNTTRGIAYDSRTIHLFPADTVKQSDVIELYYNNYENIDAKGDTLAAPNGMLEVLLYYALNILYEAPIAKDHLEKSNYYLGKYERRKAPLNQAIKSNKQTKRKRSTHITC